MMTKAAAFTSWHCLFVTACLLLVVLFTTTNAAELELQQELMGSDVAPYDDGWASSVAIDGDWAVVGAPNDDVNRTSVEPGSVFVFRRTGEVWKEVQQLFGSQATDGDEFGRSVALSHGILVVGAPTTTVDGIHYNAGSAYIFEYSDESGKFEERQYLISPDGGRDYGDFGYSVAVSGDVVLIGEPNDAYSETRDGMAHIYDRDGDDDGWVLLQTLSTPKDDTTLNSYDNDEFGNSVAIDGNTAVIGAKGHDVAYVFVKSGLSLWAMNAKLESTEYDPDQFGSHVDISGDKLLVNTYDYGENLHVFHRSPTNQTWMLHSVLNSGSFGAAIDNDILVTNFDVWLFSGMEWTIIFDLPYSTHVDISNNQIITGDSSSEANIYTLPTVAWGQTQELTYEGVLTNNNFGQAMDMDRHNDTLIICDSEGYSSYDLGYANIFTRSTITGEWIYQQQLSELSSGIDYCDDAAIDGDWLAVISDATVFMYQRGSLGLWDTTATELVVPTGIIDSSCWSCAFAKADLHGNTLVVGDSGSFVHIWTYSDSSASWIYQEVLVSPDTAQDDGLDDDQFGVEAVALDDDLGIILVGAPSSSANGDHAGIVYEFQRDDDDGAWNFASRISPDRETPGAEFGESIAFRAGIAVIGASTSHDTSYVFSLDEGDNNNWKQDAVLKEEGYAMAISGDGSRIASRYASYTQSNGTWVRETEFGSYGEEQVLVSANGDAVLNTEWDDIVSVYQLIQIVKPVADEEGEEEPEAEVTTTTETEGEEEVSVNAEAQAIKDACNTQVAIFIKSACEAVCMSGTCCFDERAACDAEVDCAMYDPCDFLFPGGAADADDEESAGPTDSQSDSSSVSQLLAREAP